MRLWQWVIGLAVLASPAVAAEAPQAHFIGGVNDYAPWYYANPVDPTRPGAQVDAFRDIAQRLRVTIEITPQPNARLIESLRDGTIDLMLAPDEPALRGADLDCGSIGSIGRLLISAASAPLSSPGNLAGKRIGLIRPYTLNAMSGKNADVEVVELENLAQGVRMLAAGRLDGIMGNDLALRSLATDSPDLARTLAPAVVLPQQNIHIWVGLASPLKDQCKALIAVAAKIRAEGMVEKVLSRY